MHRRASHEKNWLSGRSHAIVTLAGAMAGFAAYGCMYAFRKPFSAGTYDGLKAFGADFKTVAVAVQLLGYMMSKFIGIRVVSEATPARRAGMVLGLIGASSIGLLLFAVLPGSWKLAGLLLNGLPLGMIWGLIFTFIEGRRVTEFLGLGLSLSTIFASGWVKAAGRWLMERGVPEFWMPLATGALFTPLLLLSVWVLGALPPPDAADQAARAVRQPMDKAARQAFMREWGLGIVLLTGAYVGLMTYRDVRDSFMVDVLRELGHPVKSSIFASVENTVGLLVIASLLWLRWVRDNRRALIANAALIVAGPLFGALGTWLFQRGLLSPVNWLIATGFGTYLAFVPFQCLLYERLLAVLRYAGTAAFLLAIGDAFGYLGVVGINFMQFTLSVRIPWSTVLIQGSYWLALVVSVLTAAGLVYFLRHRRAAAEPASAHGALSSPVQKVC